MDKFYKVLKPAEKNEYRFQHVCSQLREEISTKSYLALQQKITKFFPKHIASTLLPKRKLTWAELKITNKLRHISLPKETYWQILQLSELKQTLNDHLRILGKITTAFNTNDLEAIEPLLDEHFRTHGASLWNMEARFALAARLSNSESSIEGVLNEFEVSLKGSLAFVMGILFADLYDQATTFGGFRTRVRRLISGYEETETGKYITAKFLGANSTSDLSIFLNYEASFSYIDLYEALTHVLIKSIKTDEEKFTELALIIGPLYDIEDIRLQHIFNFLQDNNPSFSPTKELSINVGHFPSLTKIGQPLAGTTQNVNEINYIESTLKDLISQFNNPNTDLFELSRNLTTTISKHHFLPWFHSLMAAVDGLFFPLGNAEWFIQYYGICTPTIGFSKPNELEKTPLMKAVRNYGIEIFPWAQIYSNNSELHEVFLQTIKKLNMDDPELALSELDKGSWDRFQSFYGVQLLRILALIEKDDDNGALSQCVSLAIQSESISDFLPFKSLVGREKSWTDLQSYDLADLVIGLHFASLSRDSKTRFNLEFACKELLKNKGCKSPAEIIDHFSKDDNRGTFILWKIFIPSNMRLISSLRTIEDADNARLDICRVLLDLKKDNVEIILDEIRSIIRRKELRVAEKNIESTRIYVNRDGIKRWAEEKYREQFLRIRKSRLTRTAPTIDEIQASIAQILSNKSAPSDSITKNLSDPLFIIGASIISGCFTKEDDGLEHFLSLRIRHGSLMGYLRAPLEKVDLVEQGQLTEQSPVAKHWIEELCHSEQTEVLKVVHDLSDFQNSFDLIIEQLRGEYLQVRSQTHPNGLFQASFPKIIWDVYQVYWENIESFDVFFDSVWEAFLEILETSLILVRKQINFTLMQQSENLLLGLRKGIYSCSLAPNDRAAITTAINQGTTGLQEAIRVVSQWFTFSNDTREETALDFERLMQVAQNVFKNARPAMPITIQTHRFPAKIQFSSTIIPRLIDIIFILLDNVYQHAGLKGPVTVDLWADWENLSNGKGALVLCIENPLGIEVNIESINKKLEHIRLLLSTGDIEHLLTSEGGSGLIKLARIANTDIDAKSEKPLDFGLTDENRFKVTVRFILPYQHLRTGHDIQNTIS